MEIFNSIGERLREVREEMQQTQSDFAAIAADAGVPGATRQSQAKYEKGLASPSATYLAAIAAEGADVLYILTAQRSRIATRQAPPDEQLWTETYRNWDADTKKRELRRAMGVSLTGMEPAATPAIGAGPQTASSGGINVGGANSGVINTGSHSVQQNFHKEVKGDVVGRDKIVQPPSSTREKTRNGKR